MPLFKSNPVLGNWLTRIIQAREAIADGDLNVARTILAELEDELVIRIEAEEAA